MFQVRRKVANFKPENRGTAELFFLELEREFFMFFLFNKNKLQLSFPSNSILKLNLLLGLFEGNNFLKNRVYRTVFFFLSQNKQTIQCKFTFFCMLNSLELHHLFTKENTTEENETVFQCKE